MEITTKTLDKTINLYCLDLRLLNLNINGNKKEIAKKNSLYNLGNVIINKIFNSEKKYDILPKLQYRGGRLWRKKKARIDIYFSVEEKDNEEFLDLSIPRMSKVCNLCFTAGIKEMSGNLNLIKKSFENKKNYAHELFSKFEMMSLIDWQKKKKTLVNNFYWKFWK